MIFGEEWSVVGGNRLLGEECGRVVSGVCLCICC